MGGLAQKNSTHLKNDKTPQPPSRLPDTILRNHIAGQPLFAWRPGEEAKGPQEHGIGGDFDKGGVDDAKVGYSVGEEAYFEGNVLAWGRKGGKRVRRECAALRQSGRE
jgi:hypothetical protein